MERSQFPLSPPRSSCRTLRRSSRKDDGSEWQEIQRVELGVRPSQSSCRRSILGTKDEGSCRVKGGLAESGRRRSGEGSVQKDHSLRE